MITYKHYRLIQSGFLPNMDGVDRALHVIGGYDIHSVTNIGEAPY